jgi:hypothetical protein
LFDGGGDAELKAANALASASIVAWLLDNNRALGAFMRILHGDSSGSLSPTLSRRRPKVNAG